MSTEATLADVVDLLKRLNEGIATANAEGLDVQQAAELIGVSRSKFHELDNHGLIPMASEIGTGRCRRWSRGELVSWLRAGSPSRARWQLMRAQIMRRNL